MSVSAMKDITPETESELILRAQSNDRLALNTLISIHMPIIQRLAGRLHVPACSLDELTQSGVIGMIRAILKFDVKASARLRTYAMPWIIGEMRYTLRSIANHRVLSLHEEEPCGLTLEEMLGKEDIRFSRIELHMAIEQLDKDARLLLYLRFFRDKTQKEISILIGKSQSKISKLEQRTLTQLRELLS